MFEKYFILFSHLVSKVCWLTQECADADWTVGQDHDGEHDESDDGEPLQLGHHWQLRLLLAVQQPVQQPVRQPPLLHLLDLLEAVAVPLVEVNLDQVADLVHPAADHLTLTKNVKS